MDMLYEEWEGMSGDSTLKGGGEKMAIHTKF